MLAGFAAMVLAANLGRRVNRKVPEVTTRVWKI